MRKEMQSTYIKRSSSHSSPEMLRREIEEQITEFFSEQQNAAVAYGAEFTHLWALASEQVSGGKLVRPLLMVAIFEALTESGVDAQIERATLIRLAAAIELLHFAFLLHDDVIDGDLFRRGARNLIGALQHSQLAKSAVEDESKRALHWARTGGILMGDLLLSAVHQIFARVDLSQDIRVRLLDALEHAIFETVAGEQVDVGLADGVITPDLQTVLNMTAHKTATYTFELPMRIAAILGEVGPEIEAALSVAGHHLGMAFQLQDDYLSTFGDPDEHGKDPFSDLREGKQTAIIAFARMTSAWSEIEADFGKSNLTLEKGENIRDLLTECGAEKFVLDLMDEQSAALFEVLAGPGNFASIPMAVRSVLLKFATGLDRRTS